MYEFFTVRELYDIILSGPEMQKDSIEYVELEGWVRTNRNNGSLGFIEVNDGSYFKNVQVVYFNNIDDYELASSLKNWRCKLNVIGVLKITENQKQPFEIQAKKISVLAKCAEDILCKRKDIVSNF